MPHQLAQEAPPLLGPQQYQEPFYLVLEKYDEDEQADAHKLVEYRAHQAHTEDLAGDKPYKDKGHDAVENAYRARLLHQAVNVEKEQCDEHYVDDVFDAEFEHGIKVWASLWRGVTMAWWIG